MIDQAELMKRFRAAATKFIAVVDSAPQLEREAFLASVSRSMVELYGAALFLPPVKPDTNGTDEPSFPADEEDELHKSLREKIGAIDVYWEVFDTTAKQEPVQGSLAGTFQRFTST